MKYVVEKFENQICYVEDRGSGLVLIALVDFWSWARRPKVAYLKLYETAFAMSGAVNDKLDGRCCSLIAIACFSNRYAQRKLFFRRFRVCFRVIGPHATLAPRVDVTTRIWVPGPVLLTPLWPTRVHSSSVPDRRSTD